MEDRCGNQFEKREESSQTAAAAAAIEQICD
jgi:hypothetical protein